MMDGQNIFGKYVTDYKHLVHLEKHAPGKFKRHMDALQINPMVKSVKINIWDDSKEAIVRRWKDDTQGIGVVTNNLMAIKTEILEVLFTKNRLPELVPVDSSIPEGATAYAYKVMNKFAKGRFVENRGSDASGGQVSMGLVSASLYLGEVNNSWSLEDLRNAAFTGFALDTAVLEAATFGALKHMEESVLLGGAYQNKPFFGLVNQPNITVLPAGAPWSGSADGQAIITNMNTAVNAIVENSNEVFGGVITENMTIYLPVEQFNNVATQYYGVNKDKSVMEWFERNNAWTKRTGNEVQFKSVIELAGAGVAGVDRALFGFNQKDIMEYGQSIAPRITSIVNMGSWYNAPLEYKFSGLNVKQPGGLMYMDGI